MKPGADVKSIDAIREFRAELKRYMTDLVTTLESLNIQSNRANDWIESDRTRYWPRQVKRAEDSLVEARNALLRCKMAAVEGQSKSCVDEKKAVERWVQRQRHCESQVRALRSWRQKMRQQTDEFTTRMSRLATYADNDLPKAIAALDRMIKALDKYTQIGTPSSGPGTSASSTGSATNKPDENASKSSSGDDAP